MEMSSLDFISTKNNVVLLEFLFSWINYTTLQSSKQECQFSEDKEKSKTPCEFTPRNLALDDMVGLRGFNFENFPYNKLSLNTKKSPSFTNKKKPQTLGGNG